MSARMSNSGVVLDCASAFCDVTRGHDVTANSRKEGTIKGTGRVSGPSHVPQ
jgi:hypothetical protein